MANARPRPCRRRWLFLLCAGALLVSRSALAQVVGYVVIQPIDVCLSTGWSNTVPESCSPYNNLNSNPDPSKYTQTTPIGFVDSATNVNNTRAIWLQAGIDVTFMPMAWYYNSSGQNPYQYISDFSCSSTGCSSKTFNNLTSGKTGKLLPPLSPDATTINMFFVNHLSGDNTVAAPAFGFSWIGANGIAVASDTFFPPTNAFGVPLYPVHYDTLAHEIGHNLGLDHTTYGAGTACTGVPSPNGCNVMDAGNIRVVPSGTTCSATGPNGGALYDLDTGLCTSAPIIPQADQLILGKGSSTQQGVALASVFINPVPNVNAIAGGGDVSFTVTYPRFNKAGGRSAGEYIAALILALPQGFKFGTNLFTQTGGSAQFASFELLNGNNGQGNTNCVKPISGAPSIPCLEIDFVPGTFTTNTSISFTSDIIDKGTGQPATLTELACPATATLECLDLTYVFNDLFATTSAFEVRDTSGNLTANSQFPDAAVASTIVNPATFPTLNPNQVFIGFNGPALQAFCASNPSSSSCPSGATGGEPTPTTSIYGGD